MHAIVHHKQAEQEMVLRFDCCLTEPIEPLAERHPQFPMIQPLTKTDVTGRSAGMLLRSASPSRTLPRDSGDSPGGTNPAARVKQAARPAASAPQTVKWKPVSAAAASSPPAAAAAVGLPLSGDAGAAALGLRGCGGCAGCCGVVNVATAASAIAAAFGGSTARGRDATSSDAATCSCGNKKC